MASTADWNKLDDEEEDELEDNSHLETKRDVILFCIDCSASMHELREHPDYEDIQTCNLHAALDAAMQIQKKKILVGPNDSVGILMFNTIRKSETPNEQAVDIKDGMYLYQPIGPLSAPTIQELIKLLDAFLENPDELRDAFPPKPQRVPMGDVFTSCNWVLRNGAPKTATKRVFLITDEDNPHPGHAAAERLKVSARTTLIDLAHAGVTLEPFFISRPDHAFDVSNFYSTILLPSTLADAEPDPDDPSILPESISITRIEDLLSQMRIHEVPKRAQFSVTLELAKDFKIGVKGYGLVTEQKKGTYQYFAGTGGGMQATISRVAYCEDDDGEVDRNRIGFGAPSGAAAASTEEGEEEGGSEAVPGDGRVVKPGQRAFYTAEEVKSFRTLGLAPGIRLLGFKPRSELRFEDNIKHSHFIYPDETNYAGSTRTFSALLRSMAKKDKIAIALGLLRSNSSPTFFALLPQEEREDEGGWRDPAGFHLIPIPFADDIRAAPIDEAALASEDLIEKAEKWIQKMALKNGSYPVDSYPNPALAYHNAQLQATAFHEEFDPDSFEDLTLPKVDIIHKRAGPLMEEWKSHLLDDNNVSHMPVATGSKRKAESNVDEKEVIDKYRTRTLEKLKVDQLKEFLKAKSLPVSGKKSVLIERVTEYLDSRNN